MPSASLVKWQTTRQKSLQQIQQAHASVGGMGRGRRYATQQINHAYVVLLCAEFQGFCRDLHTESVGYLATLINGPTVYSLFVTFAELNRKLDQGNPNSGNIGADFSRFGIKFWDEVRTLDRRNRRRQEYLESLNLWRNAIAHQNFSDPKMRGKTSVPLHVVRQWHTACDSLCYDFDQVMGNYLGQVLGNSPW